MKHLYVSYVPQATSDGGNALAGLAALVRLGEAKVYVPNGIGHHQLTFLQQVLGKVTIIPANVFLKESCQFAARIHRFRGFALREVC